MAATTLLPQNLDKAIEYLINWSAFRIGPALVGIMIVYAGFEYIDSKGNEAMIKEAKDRIIKSLIGLVLLMTVGLMMRAFFL